MTRIPTVLAMALILATAFAVSAESARTLPLKPRMEWKAVVLHGYIVDVTKQDKQLNGGVKKEFVWSNSLTNRHGRELLPLAFVDDATYRRAKQFAGSPVFVTAIAVTRGESMLWVVESITEPK